MVDVKRKSRIYIKKKKERKNYFLEEIEQNELISKKHKKVYTTLNYTEHFLILGSAVTGRISFFVFAFLLGISIGITSSK